MQCLERQANQMTCLHLEDYAQRAATRAALGKDEEWQQSYFKPMTNWLDKQVFVERMTYY